MYTSCTSIWWTSWRRHEDLDQNQIHILKMIRSSGTTDFEDKKPTPTVSWTTTKKTTGPNLIRPILLDNYLDARILPYLLAFLLISNPLENLPARISTAERKFATSCTSDGHLQVSSPWKAKSGEIPRDKQKDDNPYLRYIVCGCFGVKIKRIWKDHLDIHSDLTTGLAHGLLGSNSTHPHLQLVSKTYFYRTS